MKPYIGFGLLFLLLLIILPILFATSSTAAPIFEEAQTLTPYQQSWKEDFDSSILHNRWSWVRENPSLWSLTANPGYMRITSSGTLWQSENHQANVLLTEAPAGDFRVTTQVEVSPIENYHGATLYVYQDDDNYIEVARVYNNGPSVGFRREVAGVTYTTYKSVAVENIRLRLVKESQTYYGWFSEDAGVTWVYIDQYTIALNNPKVGLSAKLGPTTTPVTADFDWINLETIDYNTQWSDGFNLPDLDSAWNWMRENPSLWSLTANPGYMRITGSGSLWQSENSQTNVLLTEAPAGDFRVTSRVDVSPSENFHGATLHVYQDDDNYIEVARGYNDGQSVYLRKEEAGATFSFIRSVTEDDIRLRIVKEGDTYYGWFSEDSGVTWEYIGQYTIALTNPRVGVSARLGGSTTPVTADWDFIIIESFRERLYLPLVTK